MAGAAVTIPDPVRRGREIGAAIRAEQKPPSPQIARYVIVLAVAVTLGTLGLLAAGWAAYERLQGQDQRDAARSAAANAQVRMITDQVERELARQQQETRDATCVVLATDLPESPSVRRLAEQLGCPLPSPVSSPDPTSTALPSSSAAARPGGTSARVTPQRSAGETAPRSSRAAAPTPAGQPPPSTSTPTPTRTSPLIPLPIPLPTLGGPR